MKMTTLDKPGRAASLCPRLPGGQTDSLWTFTWSRRKKERSGGAASAAVWGWAPQGHGPPQDPRGTLCPDVCTRAGVAALKVGCPSREAEGPAASCWWSGLARPSEGSGQRRVGLRGQPRARAPGPAGGDRGTLGGVDTALPSVFCPSVPHQRLLEPPSTRNPVENAERSRKHFRRAGEQARTHTSPARPQPQEPGCLLYVGDTGDPARPAPGPLVVQVWLVVCRLKQQERRPDPAWPLPPAGLGRSRGLDSAPCTPSPRAAGPRHCPGSPSSSALPTGLESPGWCSQGERRLLAKRVDTGEEDTDHGP